MFVRGTCVEPNARPILCYIFRSRFHYYQARCFGVDATQYREEDLVEIIDGSPDYPLGRWSDRSVSAQLLQDREQCTEMQFLKREQHLFFVCILEERLWLDGLTDTPCDPPQQLILLRGTNADMVKFHAEFAHTQVYNSARAREIVDSWPAFLTREMKAVYLRRRLNLISFGELCPTGQNCFASMPSITGFSSALPGSIAMALLFCVPTGYSHPIPIQPVGLGNGKACSSPMNCA